MDAPKFCHLSGAQLMGLRADITAGLAAAFDDPNGLADAVRAFTGMRTATGTYDPNTGTAAGISVNYAGRGVFGSYELKDIDGTNILASDTELVALQLETTGTPKVGDRIGTQTVVSVDADPAAATWILQLRS
jgi:hypothetical protein